MLSERETLRSESSRIHPIKGMIKRISNKRSEWGFEGYEGLKKMFL